MRGLNGISKLGDCMGVLNGGTARENKMRGLNMSTKDGTEC